MFNNVFRIQFIIKTLLTGHIRNLAKHKKIKANLQGDIMPEVNLHRLQSLCEHLLHLHLSNNNMSISNLYLYNIYTIVLT